MGKYKKIVRCCLLLAAVFLAVPFRSFAAESFIRGYAAVDANLELYCCGVEKEGLWSVTALGKQIYAEPAKERIPVTVYCLADVSGSMDDGQMDQIRRILGMVSASMEPEDNMVIGTLGNAVNTSGLLETEEERQKAIETLVQGNEDTNLYAGIAESLSELKNSSLYHEASFLLILSDGEDDQASGYTIEEAEKAVADSCIPVITAAILRENPTEEQIENGKLLGSFARNSIGGEHYAPLLSEESAEEIGEAIWNQMEKNVTLVVDLTEEPIDVRGETVLFSVSYENGDVRRWDSIRVYADELPVPETELPTESQSETEAFTESESETEAFTERESESETEASAESESESETETSAEPQSETEGFTEAPGEVGTESLTEGQSELETGTQRYGKRMILIPAAGGMLFLLLVCIAVWKRKKRKRKGQREKVPATAGEEEKKEQKVCCEIRLTAIKQSRKTYTIVLHRGEILTVGRSREAQVVLDSQDMKISGIHCRMKWENGRLYVEDRKSKNGTFLNGVPIRDKGWVYVPDGDSLRIGLFEYRVRIQIKS